VTWISGSVRCPKTGVEAKRRKMKKGIARPG